MHHIQNLTYQATPPPLPPQYSEILPLYNFLKTIDSILTSRIYNEAQQREEESANDIANSYAKSIKTCLKQFDEWKIKLDRVINDNSKKAALSDIKEEWLYFRHESIDEMFAIGQISSNDDVSEETSTDTRKRSHNKAKTPTDKSLLKQNRDGPAAGCHPISHRGRVCRNGMKKDKTRDAAFEKSNAARDEYRKVVATRNVNDDGHLQVEKIHKAKKACESTTKRHDDEYCGVERMRRFPKDRMKESYPLYGMIYAEVNELFPSGSRGGGRSKKWDIPTDPRITIRVGSLASATEVTKTLRYVKDGLNKVIEWYDKGIIGHEGRPIDHSETTRDEESGKSITVNVSSNYETFKKYTYPNDNQRSINPTRLENTLPNPSSDANKNIQEDDAAGQKHYNLRRSNRVSGSGSKKRSYVDADTTSDEESRSDADTGTQAIRYNNDGSRVGRDTTEYNESHEDTPRETESHRQKRQRTNSFPDSSKTTIVDNTTTSSANTKRRNTDIPDSLPTSDIDSDVINSNDNDNNINLDDDDNNTRTSSNSDSSDSDNSSDDDDSSEEKKTNNIDGIALECCLRERCKVHVTGTNMPNLIQCRGCGNYVVHFPCMEQYSTCPIKSNKRIDSNRIYCISCYNEREEEKLKAAATKLTEDKTPESNEDVEIENKHVKSPKSHILTKDDTEGQKTRLPKDSASEEKTPLPDGNDSCITNTVQSKTLPPKENNAKTQTARSKVNNKSTTDTSNDKQLSPPTESNRFVTDSAPDAVRATQSTPTMIEETTTNTPEPDITLGEDKPVSFTTNTTIVTDNGVDNNQTPPNDKTDDRRMPDETNDNKKPVSSTTNATPATERTIDSTRATQNGYTNNDRTPNNKNPPRQSKGPLKRQETANKPANLAKGVLNLHTRPYNCPNYAECEGHSLKPCVECKRCGVMVGCFYEHDKEYKYCHQCYTSAEFVKK